MDFFLRDFAYPLEIVRTKLFLDKSQFFSSQEIQAYQLERLQALLQHAYTHVPYYRQIFDERKLKPQDIKQLTDIRLLPVLTKEIVRNNRGRLQATNGQRFRPVASRTSGSTGTALEFLLDKPTSIMEFAAVWRHWNWAGYHIGNKFADLRGKVLKQGVLWKKDWRLHSLNLSSFRLNKDVVATYAKVLKDFHPVMLRGYPSSLSLFAQWLKEQGITGLQPKAVVTSSETLLDQQRAILTEVFGCPVLDWYGQMERVAAIGQCTHGTYHINSEYGVLEILNEQGNAASSGEIIATSLHNYAMPFIRYRTNDQVEGLAAGTCACGRTLPSVKKVLGRIEDVIITPEGDHVGRLDAAFKYSRGIKLSQIVQDHREAMTVRIVRSELYSTQDETTLITELRKRVGDSIKIDIQYVDDIPRTAAGKLKFVISQVKG